ncbi:MAG: hypothetical protein L6V93_10320 [Clostridiales bacterium]|nr:MAG: hypothetical protein L6V93_10320 [Clostridiales bacterium]
MKFTEYINDGLKKICIQQKISFQTPAHKGKLDIMTEDFSVWIWASLTL